MDFLIRERSAWMHPRFHPETTALLLSERRQEDLRGQCIFRDRDRDARRGLRERGRNAGMGGTRVRVLSAFIRETLRRSAKIASSLARLLGVSYGLASRRACDSFVG